MDGCPKNTPPEGWWLPKTFGLAFICFFPAWQVIIQGNVKSLNSAGTLCLQILPVNLLLHKFSWTFWTKVHSSMWAHLCLFSEQCSVSVVPRYFYLHTIVLGFFYYFFYLCFFFLNTPVVPSVVWNLFLKKN